MNNQAWTRAWEFYHPERVPRQQSRVNREAVPCFVDRLDVLLALWISESMVDEGGSE